MTKPEKKYPSEHLADKEKAVKQLKQGPELSNTLFERVMEAEKEKILVEYTTIYEKALEKAESLETERKKLDAGKIVVEKNEKGEFVEKPIYEKQAVQRIKQISENLSKIYSAIDEAMLKGGYENWQALQKLTGK